MEPKRTEESTRKSTEPVCHSCGAREVFVFYEVKGVPAHSVLLVPTRDAAGGCPKGDIVLGFCQACGFIWNLAFDPGMHSYSGAYEETQGFSGTFREFHRDLATRLIDRYELRDKTIMEIGCGKGEFLSMLCELGGNRGIGFDPAYVSDRNQNEARDRMTVIRDFYSEKYAEYQGDFICCKMTLEHIEQTYDFVRTVRRSVGSGRDTVVFFQVPDATRILREVAFWDIYYEHCSYFSPESLMRLFVKCEFEVMNVERQFGGQYLTIEARPGPRKATPMIGADNDLEDLRKDVAYFASSYGDRVEEWKRRLAGLRREGRRAVLWGSGSKGVAFLTTLNVEHEIEYVVDINPYRHGTYMAGTGQEIIDPSFLVDYQPDTVIVMNPIYREEVAEELKRMGLSPELVTV